MRHRHSFAAFLLALVLAACEALPWTTRAHAEVWPPMRTRETGSRYAGEARSGFLVGGLGFWTDTSVLLGNAWGIGGGLRFPLGSWALVPRLELEGGSDVGGSAWMARAGVGGRIATQFTGRSTFVEAGPGVAYYETTARWTGAPELASSGVTPYLALTTGITSDPDLRPGFVIETQFVIPAAAEGPSVLLIRVGVEF